MRDNVCMPDDPTKLAPPEIVVPPEIVSAAEIVVPPGVDVPRGGNLAEVLRPHGRSIVVSTAIAVVLAIVLLIVLPRPHVSAVKAVSTAKVVARARAVAPAIVHVPDPLPPGWTADSAHFEVTAPGAHLHIGYVGPDHGYNGLEESDYTALHTNLKIFVAQMTADGDLVDLVTINGLVWTHDVSSRKSTQQSLIFYGPTTTTIVTGTSSLTDLTQLAASLHITSGEIR
jgi:hypothetical protein